MRKFSHNLLGSLIVILGILTSCQSDPEILNFFETEVINDRTCLKISKPNLIQIARLNDDQLKELVQALDLVETPMEDGKIGYYPPYPGGDGYLYDTQFITREKSGFATSIEWTNFYKKTDHFKDFEEKNRAQFVPNSNSYMFFYKKDLYGVILKKTDTFHQAFVSSSRNTTSE